MRTKFHLCVLPLASLKVKKENCLRLFVVVQTKWLSWKLCYMHAYQVSSPCVVPLTSLRSEEVIKKKSSVAFCCCRRHGNDVIHMGTKFEE